MGIFNEIGNWFNDLFKDDVAKEEEQELINKLAGMEVAQREKMDEIVKNYAEASRPEDKTFEYLEEYTPIDDETLKKQSEASFSDKYEENKQKAADDYQESIKKLEDKDKEYELAAKGKSEDANAALKQKSESFKNTASKKGIADSSIVASKGSDLENERDKAVDEVMAELKRKLSENDSKKQKAASQKEEKVLSLDEKFKKDVEKMFNKLLDAEQDKVDAVKKANEKTANEEKKYKEYQDKVYEQKADEMRKMQAEQKAQEEIGKFLPHRKEEYENRYQLAKEFYGQYNKKSALEAIKNNSSLQKFLGYYYQRLIGEIQNG